MNLFSISSLILCLSSIAFSLIIYRTNRSSKINKAWVFSCISFSLWSLGLSGVTLSTSYQGAFLWQYLLDISAIFLPYLYFIFILELLNIEKKYIRYFLFAVAFLLSIFSFTTYFKKGMLILYGFYWVDPGEFYIVFPTYFMAFALITLGLLIERYFKLNKDNPLRAQVRNTLIAGILGYFGGISNFFPQFFSIYPYGNYLVIFYIILMVYGVLKYKLLSAKVISAQIFSTALILVSLFNLLKSTDISDWLLNFLILTALCIFSLFLINSVNKEIEAREKIEALATNLKKANDRLTDLDKQKSEFISFATHQLRAPLTAMKGYASLILEGEFGALTKETKEAVSRMFDSSKTLAVIVDDYLNISRIELGTMKYAFEIMDLKKLMTDSIAELKPNIEKTGLKLDFSTDPKDPKERFMIHADKDKLKQVILNIIDNSMKYTPKGSVDVLLTKKKDEKKILISVKDTGVGIAPEVMPKLFAKFVRANNANRQNIYGTGLGLFIAKEIINSHNGHIWAESPGEGKGSTMFIELEMVG